MQRLSEVDITNYVLNELEPSERLFVESLMLGCEESRADALAMMETARLLEEGLDKELAGLELVLDQPRRDRICAYKSGSFWRTLGNAAATLAALAACVAFSLTAPPLSRFALGREGYNSSSELQGLQSGDVSQRSDIMDPGAFPTFANESGDTGLGISPSEDLPTRVLFPTGAVNFVEMPLPALGGDTN
jgi:hypothetical protein